MRGVTAPIIKAEKRLEDTITHGTLTLYIDPSYRKEHHFRQYGTMVGNFKDLKDGEKVYFHYLSLNDKPSIPPMNWVINYAMLYCVIRDSQIEMLNDYILIRIIEEPEKKSGSIIVEEKKKSIHRGIVAHVNNYQLKAGDEVLFDPVMCFENEIEGDDYYLMEVKDLIAKVVETNLK